LVDESQGSGALRDFISNGREWQANLDGDSSHNAAVYLYRGVGNLGGTLNGQYMPDAPADSSNKGVIWLDGSQGEGISRGGPGFNLGPFVALSLLGLNAGQQYTINFELNTEVNTVNDPNNTKGGPSGLLVRANGITQEYITPANAPQSNPSTAPWTHGSYDFVFTPNALGIDTVFFVDDPAAGLNNERLSSNIFLSNVSLVPESGLVLVLALGAGFLGVWCKRALHTSSSH
jgi:hypothetical protein